MSRKSRQKKGRTVLSKLLPVWILIPMLVLSLGAGILCVTMPWIARPTPYEDTIPLSATIRKVKGEYHHRKHHRLDAIHLYFEDHDSLMFDKILAHDSLLEKLEAYPAGTVFDMRLEPNGIDVMTLSVNGVDVFTYEAACRAIRVNNAMGVAMSVFFLVAAIYAAWSLYMTWKYRRLTP